MCTNTMSPEWDGKTERRGQQWLTVARVAKRFGFSNQHITSLVRNEIILGKKGKRAWRIDPVSVRRWWGETTKNRPDENKDRATIEREDSGGNDEN